MEIILNLKEVNVNTNNALLLKETGGDHLLSSYETAFNQIIKDIMKIVLRYLENVLQTNSSKIIYDE